MAGPERHGDSICAGKNLRYFPRFGVKEDAKATSSCGVGAFFRVIGLEKEIGNPVYNPEIETAVLSAMEEVQPRNAVELADAIDELVRDVNRVANRLVDRGLARSWKVSGRHDVRSRK